MGGAQSRAIVESWTTVDVADFVGQLGDAYKQYEQLVYDNDVDGKMLLELQAADLDDLGIKNIHKRKFRNKLSELHTNLSSSSVDGVSLEAGTVLAGNFELETALGSGGMGLVWCARGLQRCAVEG